MKKTIMNNFYFQLFKGIVFTLFFMLMAINSAFSQKNKLMVRIADIEIFDEYLEEYKTILKEESSASVRLEEGVISIFPMWEKEEPTKIRILEIYANVDAYKAHLKTPHFLEYKNGTLKMVKSLKLIEMGVLDEDTMKLLFRKIDN